MLPPIQITLYDPKKNEILAEYSQSIVSWGLLKKAVAIQRASDASIPKEKQWWQFLKKDNEAMSPEEAQMGAISQFVVDLFGNRFTIKELEAGADVGEVMAVFQAVLARATASVRANPTRKPSFKKQ